MSPEPPFPTFELFDAPRAASLEDLVSAAPVKDQLLQLYSSTTVDSPTPQFEDLWHFPNDTPGRQKFTSAPQPSAPIFVRSMALALVHPASGLVFDRMGRVLIQTIVAAQYLDPSWARVSPIATQGAAIARATPAQSSQAGNLNPVLYANHGGYTVFGHLMFETIPIALIFSRWLRSRRMTMLMPPAKSTAMPDRLLSMAGLPADVQVRARTPFVWVSGLIVSSTCNGRATFAPGPMHHQFARAITARTPIANIHPRRRVFLTRSGGDVTQRRDLTNEAELIAALTPFGFDVVNPSTLKDNQSINLFANAECLISTGGSVWADLLFARPGTLAIELLPEHKAAGGDVFGVNLAKAMSLPYISILTRSTGSSAGNIDVHADVPLVVDRVRRGLERLTELGL